MQCRAGLLLLVLPASALAQGMDVVGDPLPAGAVARLGTTRLSHREQGGFAGVAYMPDGKAIVSVAGKTIRFWEAVSGKLLRELKCDEAVVAFSLAPDGKRFATSHAVWHKLRPYDYQVRLWDTASGKETARFLAPAKLTTVAFSGEGKTIAGLDSVIYRWDIVTGKRLPDLHVTGGCSAFAYSPDGGRVAVGSYHGRIHIFDAAGRKEEFVLERHDHQVASLVFSADGQRLASSSRDQSARLWDLEAKKEIHKGKGCSSEATPIAYSPNGEWVVGRDESHFALRFWNREWKSHLSSRHSRGVVQSVAFAPDSKTVVAAYFDGCLRLMDPNTGRDKDAFPVHRDDILALAFLPDGGSIVTVSRDSTARVWDARTGKHRYLIREDHNTVGAVALSANGRHLAWVSTPRKSGGHFDVANTLLDVWDVEKREQVRQIPLPHPFNAIALSPDGKLLAAAMCTSRWSPGSGRTDLHRVFTISEVAAGKTVFTDSAHASYFPHQFRGGEERPSDVGFMSSLAFSPDGAIVATDATQALALVDAAAGKPLRTRLEPVRKEKRDPAAKKPKGLPAEMFLGGDFGAIRVTGGTAGVAFSPDGQLLLKANGFDPLQVFERATGRAVLTVPVPENLTAFALAPGNRILALADADGRIQFWDMAGRQLFAELRGHELPVHALAFSHDGKLLATGFGDGVALVWDMERIAGRLPPVRARRDFATSWAQLLSAHGAEAEQAIWALASSAESVPFLRRHVRVVSAADVEKRIRGLIRQLDSDRYADREAAVKELKSLGQLAAPALVEANKANPSLEVRRRLHPILAAMDKKPHSVEAQLLSGEPLRTVRALRALEQIGTKEALALIGELAAGYAATRETREACAALERAKR